MSEITIERILSDWDKDNSHFDYDAVGFLLEQITRLNTAIEEVRRECGENALENLKILTASKDAEITRLNALLAEAREVYEKFK